MVLYQAAACLSLVQRKTTFVHQPTGSGKSLIWLLASLTLTKKGHSGITLVIFPLVALLRDQFRRITQIELDDDSCVIIDKGTGYRLSSNKPFPIHRLAFLAPSSIASDI